MPARRHGQAETRLYGIWSGMWTRCINPNRRNYKWYGAKGVKVCDRWKVFENFRDDMGNPPPGMTLDRKDSNGDYEPENCRWVPDTVQSNNRSNNRLVVVCGVPMTLAQAAKDSKVPYTTIVARLNRGWTIEDALASAPDAQFRVRGGNHDA